MFFVSHSHITPGVIIHFSSFIIHRKNAVQRAGVLPLHLIAVAELVLGAAAVREFAVHGEDPAALRPARKLVKIADALQCSIDYLLGRTDVPEVNTTSPAPLPEDEQILLSRYRRLDPDGKELVRARALECLRDIQQGDGTTAESASRLA